MVESVVKQYAGTNNRFHSLDRDGHLYKSERHTPRFLRRAEAWCTASGTARVRGGRGVGGGGDSVQEVDWAKHEISSTKSYTFQ